MVKILVIKKECHLEAVKYVTDNDMERLHEGLKTEAEILEK